MSEKLGGGMKLKQCPFCGAKPTKEKREEYYWYIKHDESCWIVNTGLITNFCQQTITNKMDAEYWNKREM
jgi:hypothetical protein